MRLQSIVPCMIMSHTYYVAYRLLDRSDSLGCVGWLVIILITFISRPPHASLRVNSSSNSSTVLRLSSGLIAFLAVVFTLLFLIFTGLWFS